MPRHVFFSFHFQNDFWRAQQVRNINALEGQLLANPNDWEEVKKNGDEAVKKWIGTQMNGKSCIICLVGAETANRPWVIYELSKGWNDGKGVLAIRIDKLLNKDGQSSIAGPNPLSKVSFTGTSRTLADVCALKTPIGADSKASYKSIADNIETWIEEAIKIRAAAK